MYIIKKCAKSCPLTLVYTSETARLIMALKRNERFQHVPKCGFADFHVFFMNITVKTGHICRFTDRYYLWNDIFSVLSQKFCPFKGFLDLRRAKIFF